MNHTNSRLKQWLGLAPVAAALVAFAPATQAAIIAPVGLNPGDTYHLIFVTSTTRDATSANIADYNSFAQGVANAEGIGSTVGVSWYAVASTDTVNAIDNATVSAPVYLMDGTTLVSTSAAFYSNTHAAAINLEEDGVTSSAGRVWSASYANGTLNTLGGNTGLGGTAGKSISGDTSAGAIANGGKWLQQHWGTSHGTAQSFYALSEELTVVPEPASMSLLAIGGIALLRRKRR